MSPQTASIGTNVNLDDKWSVDNGRVIINGTQAIARVLLARKALDEKRGLIVQAADGYAAALRAEQSSDWVRASAALGGGRTLLRLGQFDEAVRSLKTARRLSRQHCAVGASPNSDEDSCEPERWDKLLADAEAYLIECLGRMVPS